MNVERADGIETGPADRVGKAFEAMSNGGAPQVIPFVTAGFPDQETTAEVLRGLDRMGIGICEVGVPFSDPIADGPVIASSMHDAIEHGFTPGAMFDTVRSLRGEMKMGLVAMSSVTLAHKRGVGAFVSSCASSGFDGVLFPDLPVEESDEARRAALGAGLVCPMLVAPTTPGERAVQIAQSSTGFVYLLARTGITGVREALPDVGRRVAELRKAGDVPIACGFGIGSARAVRAVTQHADAAIVGSAIVGLMQRCASEGADAKRIADEVCAFVGELADG